MSGADNRQTNSTTKIQIQEDNTMNERAIELEKILGEVCGQYEDDCTKCPYSKECDEYSHLNISHN